MGKLKSYKGSVEVISGIKQANNQDFPLLEANAIQVDETGKRLDRELQGIKSSIASLGSGGGGGSAVTNLNISNGEEGNALQQILIEDDEVKGSKAYGKYSVALNQNNNAYQRRSVAIGGGNKAGLSKDEFDAKYPNGIDEDENNYEKSNSDAFVSGTLSNASARGAFIGGGYSTTVDGRFSGTLGGGNNLVEGEYNVINGGWNNQIKNRVNPETNQPIKTKNSTIFGGYNNTIAGDNSYTGGSDNEVQADNVHLFGRNLKTNKAGRTIIGKRNDENSWAVFAVGNGQDGDTEDDSTRSNAFEVFEDGRAKVHGQPIDDNDAVRRADVANCLNQANLSYNTSLESLDMTISKLFGGASTTYRLFLKDLPFYNKTETDRKISALKTDSAFLLDIATLAGDFVEASMNCTQGLKYRKNVEGDSAITYSVIGSAYIDDADIIMPSMHRGFPVTEIGKNAFMNNTEIESVRTLVDSKIKSIEFSAFYGCSNLKEVVLPDGVTRIGGSSFASCSNLTEIVIPDSVTSIGSYAFNSCSSLKEIVIPNSVSYIGVELANGNPKTIIYCESDHAKPYWESTWNVAALPVVWGDKGLRYDISDDETYCIVSRFVTIGSTVTNLEIPSTVFRKTIKEIGNAAFKGKSNIKNLLIPDSVTSIGDEAFAYCDLNSIKLSNSLTSIGKDAFLSNTGLGEIVIPKSVTTIGNRAFGGCHSLTVFCEAENQPSGWDANWHNSAPTVYWYSDTYKWSQYTRYWHYVDGVPTLW